MYRWLSIIFLILFCSCRNPKAVAEASFTDSLLTHYTLPAPARMTDGNVQFWKDRSLRQPDDYVAKEKYAHALIGRFHLFGAIADLRLADAILYALTNGHPVYDAAPLLLTLANVKLLQHHFGEAARIITQVRGMETEPFATSMLQFDTDFELGRYGQAKLALLSNKAPSDYAYNFRQAKLDHLYGAPDSAIAHMLKAAAVATNPYVRGAALSNAADLLLHSGEVDKAYRLYKQCIGYNSADFHSIDRVGWIALVHDGNDSTAVRVFSFLRDQTRTPDPLLKLSQAYEVSNPAKAKAYAQDFVRAAGNSAYGNMYNKYLIEVYTGILNAPAQAVAVARRELRNRATPQTWAWLAWALASNRQTAEASRVYAEKISGQPLEGLELFWMGKLMTVLERGYNAQQYFKEAQKNQYDLSPAMIKELKVFLR